MYDKRFKYIQWLLYILLGIGAILGIVFYLSGSGGSMDNALYFAYIVAIIAGIAILSTAALSMFMYPKSGIKILIAIAAMVVVGLICYFVSKNEFDHILLEKWSITAGFSKTIGAALYFTWVIVIVTFGTLIYSALIRFFK